MLEAGRASLSSHGLKAGDFPLRPLHSPELKSAPWIRDSSFTWQIHQEKIKKVS
jgi:hypothetical protein